MNNENNLVLFHPIRANWNILLHYRRKSIVQINPNDPLLKKGGTFLLNGLKNRVIEVALAIATIAALPYSLITYSSRWNDYLKRKEGVADSDLARLSPQERQEIETRVNDYFEKHPENKEIQKFKKTIVSQCARSQKVYGPIIKNWVDTLLERAHREGKKLVFMARDGIPYYWVATELMKKEEYKAKYPSLAQKDGVVLGHFSRKLTMSAFDSKENGDLFKRYVSEELGIHPGDRCILVDIGFDGTLIDPLRKLIPQAELDFHFLITTTERAEGFLGSPQKPFRNFATKQNNISLNWLEQTHCGNLVSATKLVAGEDGHVHPNSLYPKKLLADEKLSLPYLIRKFCLKGLVEHAAHLPRFSEAEAQKAKDQFSQTMREIRSLQIPLEIL